MSHDPASRMPDDVSRTFSETVEQPGQVGGEELGGVGTRRLLGSTGPAQVPAQHPMVRCQRFDVRRKEIEPTTQAVGQHHEWPGLAGKLVVQPDSVGADVHS